MTQLFRYQIKRLFSFSFVSHWILDFILVTGYPSATGQARDGLNQYVRSFRSGQMQGNEDTLPTF